MKVEPLVSVDTWPVRQVEYTTAHGEKAYGLYISSCRRHGEEFCYLIAQDGTSITVPASRVKRLPEATSVRISIIVKE